MSTFSTRFGHRLAIACLLATLAAPGFAQFGGGAGGGGMGGGGGRHGRSSDSSNAAPRSDIDNGPQTAAGKLRDKLYDLRLRLLITSQQSALWDDFYNRVWDLLGKNGLRPPAEGELGASELLQQRAAEATEKATQWQRLADSTAKLYAAMSPEQQHIADQELPALLPLGR